MMPVEDHDVHPMTRIKAGWKYGCYDKPRTQVGYYAPDRQYRPDGTYVVIQRFIKNEMSEKCRNFYLWDKDPACEGCDSPKDTAYRDRMISL